MRKFIFILFTAVFLWNIDTFAAPQEKNPVAHKAQKAKKCLFPKSRKRAPNWVCTAQDDSLAIAAVGSFAQSDAGIEFMEEMASANARVQLARKLHDISQKNITASENATNKKMDDQDHILITRMIDESLQGTKILRKAYDPMGRLYVLVGFDEAGAQKLQAAIAARNQQQQNP